MRHATTRVLRPPVTHARAAALGMLRATRCIAFWTAILLPAVILGALALGAHGVAFAAIPADFACLVAGHEHRPNDPVE